ncbi:ABC-2 type transport system ATP-binding protein [Desulfotomaculum arcticum]|uniref:ABC-2 type transport system ATP-binding protein n=1 Tax=Desulfotruncus arcticus DSM 17038 TaxID=1121424 RepID=A0A1I2U268_9FIRM|nr:ABC transporter ATP-binding protein [Desulfotruncus arcticus]SFG71164.1 ABC-2 type transport system ATP-binding protein [Desulfotomaculum arcticum] [Desulfotruncus arcticus DSM 17038]
MIKAVGLTKAFGQNVAVGGVGLQVAKGSIFGLVGPDGAGKTTLIRMICGLITPDQGEVSLMGHPAAEIEKARKSMGYMPQRFSLYGDLTVMENIIFFGSLYKLGRATINQRADEILAVTGLASFKKRFADNLSGGMKQKLALTCSLVARPGMLVLDEPTYGVDPESRKEFWKILYRLNKEGMTILVSTPYMDEAELCKQVAFIDKGKITAIGSPSSLKKDFGFKVFEVRAGTRDPEIFNGLQILQDMSFYGDKYHLVVNDPAAAVPAIGAWLADKNVEMMSCKEVAPSMEDVFVSLAEKEVL